LGLRNGAEAPLAEDFGDQGNTMRKLSWEAEDLRKVLREIDPRPGARLPTRMLYLRWTEHSATAGNEALERALTEFERNEWITRDPHGITLTLKGFSALR